MTRLASLQIHSIFEEVIVWLETIQHHSPTKRQLLIFRDEVLPRFVEILPEFMQALNQASSDPIQGERRKFFGERLVNPPAKAPEADFEYLSARVRRRGADDGTRERQCIGPIVGERGSCVGRGAATYGWQAENASNFARKRSQFQARCKICDSHRSQGRQRQLTRRSAAARHWLELSETFAQTKDFDQDMIEALLKLSVSILEEMRHDWWNTLHHQAFRLIALRGRGDSADSAEAGWFAVDVDKKHVFEGQTPGEALRVAGVDNDDRMLVVVPKSAMA